MKRMRPERESTRLVWEPVFEELMCERCGAILYWDFDFKACPYCHRRITEKEPRKAKEMSRTGRGTIIT